MEDHELTRISECAWKLGISVQYIRLLKAAGNIFSAPQIFGGQVFPQADVDCFKAMNIVACQCLKPFVEVVISA